MKTYENLNASDGNLNDGTTLGTRLIKLSLSYFHQLHSILHYQLPKIQHPSTRSAPSNNLHPARMQLFHRNDRELCSTISIRNDWFGGARGTC